MFEYLVFIGIRATGTRIIYIPKFFIIPLVLSGLKYKLFLTGNISVWLGYFICLVVASFASYKYSAMQKIKIITERMSVQLPGTYCTLIVLMAFFVVKYFFGYIGATNPTYYNDIKIFELSISGIFSILTFSLSKLIKRPLNMVKLILLLFL
ncbi:MAG: hypothetical protein AB8B67_05050 [Rickettsiaceae bacterium]